MGFGVVVRVGVYGTLGIIVSCEVYSLILLEPHGRYMILPESHFGGGGRALKSALPPKTSDICRTVNSKT